MQKIERASKGMTLKREIARSGCELIAWKRRRRSQ
jgi:hypothetical protein